jgi:hypothetical protein
LAPSADAGKVEFSGVVTGDGAGTHHMQEGFGGQTGTVGELAAVGEDAAAGRDGSQGWVLSRDRPEASRRQGGERTEEA